MKSACRHLFAAFALLCGINASAAPYPTDEQLRDAVGSVRGMLQAEGLELQMLNAQEEGLTQPLLAAGLNLNSGACMIFYNSKPEGGLTEFFGALPAEEMPIWLKAIAVHEATHCFEQREAYLRKRFAKVLPPNIEHHDDMTIQGYLSVVKSGAVETWGEALADIASILYLKQAHPDRWSYFASGIASMRRDLAAKWPAHNTSAWLDKVIETNAEHAHDHGVFEAAFHLRRQYKP